MYRKGITRPYLFLGALLFCWLSLPPSTADEMRLFSVASLSPAWNWVRSIQKYLLDRPSHFWGDSKQNGEVKIAQLELENGMLRAQLEKISHWLTEEERILGQIGELKKFQEKVDLPFYERRLRHLLSVLYSELIAIPSQVIYRDPSSWSSSLWVNVGEEDNQALGSPVIAKNSPVVSGISLVGVVDFVGKKQSRVRLLTDSGLSPAVRCARGNHYLAKGEVHGSGAPLWRSRSPLLKGVGFNYDYPDEEGACPKDIPLLQEGDLLVTTGFDGVFPPDLQVGFVKEVYAPKPGGFAYEIDVRPMIDLNHLETLFILPPRSD